VSPLPKLPPTTTAGPEDIPPEVARLVRALDNTALSALFDLVYDLMVERQMPDPDEE
jgi:hypothetical protein